jgi:hypothetical protein
MVDPADLVFVGVLAAVMLPLIAASRLNGSEEDPRDENGGLILVNGAEPRRFFEMLANFRGGDRPAGAVRGARGDATLDRAGVDTGSMGGGMDLTGVMEKVNGFSPMSLLLFLVGENIDGSAFSESASSYVEGAYDRLLVVFTGEDADNGLPLNGELFARKPEVMSQVFRCIESCQKIGIPFWRFFAELSCCTRELLSSPKGNLAIEAVDAIANDESLTRPDRSRAVVQHRVCGEYPTCFGCQQRVEVGTATDESAMITTWK